MVRFMERRIDVWAAGMAIFAMFFGAGNIIFPLALGQFALDKSPIALFGLLITSVLIPFTGLLTMFLYEGKVSEFFDRMGKIPGRFLACFTIALLGPLGCAPRCIVLAYSTIAISFPGLSLPIFSAITCLLIFIFVFEKGRILSLIGYVLSPLKILLLFLIILIGFWNVPDMQFYSTNQTSSSLFFHGLMEGYNTLDLIGSFFFAPVIIGSLTQMKPGLNRSIFKASVIGAGLLSVIYIGFCLLAYTYASELRGIPSDRLLGAIAVKVLGAKGALMVGLTVAVACFTTSIALIAAFASYMQKEIFADKIGYRTLVVISLLITFAITTFEFQGIAAFLTPVLQMCYPILIALTFYNLVYRLFFDKKFIVS